MSGIPGIGGVPDPISLNTASGRARRTDNRPAAASNGDSVQVSSDAASLAKLSGASENVEAQRAERIAQAKENLENGTHKVQAVLEVVASRISKYIDLE